MVVLCVNSSESPVLTAGISGLVPTLGNPGSSVVNAVGSLIYGFDASMINAVAEATVNQLLK